MIKQELTNLLNLMAGERRHDYYVILNRIIEDLDMQGVKYLYNLFFYGRASKKHMVSKLHEHYNWNMIASTEFGIANVTHEPIKDSEIESAFKYLENNHHDKLEKVIKSYIKDMEDRN